MEITELRDGDIVTIGLKGRLDGTTSKGVEDRMLEIIDAGGRRLILDLAQLDYISSVGLRIFMMAAKRLKTLDGRIVVCALQPTVAEVFEIAGFTTIFTIFDSRDAAATGVR